MSKMKTENLFTDMYELREHYFWEEKTIQSESCGKMWKKRLKMRIIQ